jgi:hypothetical protein
LRKCTVEPVFGVIKHVMKFRQFLLRGITGARGEWSLVCLAWNLKRMNASARERGKNRASIPDWTASQRCLPSLRNALFSVSSPRSRQMSCRGPIKRKATDLKCDGLLIWPSQYCMNGGARLARTSLRYLP